MAPGVKIALAAEILIAYRRARTLLRDDDLPGALAALRERTGGGGVAQADVLEAARLGRNVERLLSALPTDDRCLIRSLVTLRLLDRRGIASTLVLGVQAPAATLDAHAWLEVDGRPVLDPGAYPRLVEL